MIFHIFVISDLLEKQILIKTLVRDSIFTLYNVPVEKNLRLNAGFLKNSSFSQVCRYKLVFVMAMTLSFHENLDSAEPPQIFDFNTSLPDDSSDSDKRIHLFLEKMQIPEFINQVSRPRLLKLLKKSSEQNGATLITGRAATGKSALASSFTANYSRVAWYRIDTAESDWNIFSRYLAAIFDEDFEKLKDSSKEVPVFVEKLFSSVAPKKDSPMLIVLDDVHNVFDTEWFSAFFVTLLAVLTPEIHLVLLSRTKPPQPLWRVRSKQILGIIDEKLLAFNLKETKELFAKFGISQEKAANAHKKSFGRISRLKQFIEA
jgi:hypothetical protein